MGKPLVNTFSWAASRRELLEKCLRAYFWNCYGMWDGWLDTAPPEKRLAYRLKKLNNRWAWSGNAVHHAIGRFIAAVRANRQPQPAETVIAEARQRMRFQFAASRTGLRNRKDATGFWGLTEHEYREDVADDQWLHIWERAERCLCSFFNGPWPDRIRAYAAKGAILEADVGDAPPSSFQWNGTTMFTVPDLAIRTEDGGALVIDWKTGKPGEEHGDQLLGYALYVEAKHGIPRERITAQAVYLQTGQEVTYPTGPEDFTRYEQELAAGIEMARALLVDEDTSRNQPKPIEEFTQTDNRSTCARCAFRRLCGRENPQ